MVMWSIPVASSRICCSALELLDMHLPLRIALGQAVGTKRLVDARIDRELIAIDLRADGVEVHVA